MSNKNIDLKRSCTADMADSLRSFMAVDGTFNLSSLFLTITVFKKQVMCKTHKSLQFFGPHVFARGQGHSQQSGRPGYGLTTFSANFFFIFYYSLSFKVVCLD